MIVALSGEQPTSAWLRPVCTQRTIYGLYLKATVSMLPDLLRGAYYDWCEEDALMLAVPSTLRQVLTLRCDCTLGHADHLVHLAAGSRIGDECGGNIVIPIIGCMGLVASSVAAHALGHNDVARLGTSTPSLCLTQPDGGPDALLDDLDLATKLLCPTLDNYP